MKKDRYSLYEAKAHLSAIVRRVREGRTVVVTVHGRPVAEIRPVIEGDGGTEARLRELAERGVLTPARSRGAFVAVRRRPGALARFLDDRDA
jgi:prevent-host-death family protein